MNCSPPRLPAPHPSCRADPPVAGRARPGRAPLHAAVLLVLALVLVRLANLWGLPLPGCGFRLATGIPCVGCGATRAVLALSQGEWSTAWQLNPAATLAALVVGAGFLGWLVDAAFGTRCLTAVKARLPGARLAWVVGGMLALNWIYLILTDAP